MANYLFFVSGSASSRCEPFSVNTQGPASWLACGALLLYQGDQRSPGGRSPKPCSLIPYWVAISKLKHSIPEGCRRLRKRMKSQIQEVPEIYKTDKGPHQGFMNMDNCWEQGTCLWGFRDTVFWGCHKDWAGFLRDAADFKTLTRL